MMTLQSHIFHSFRQIREKKVALAASMRPRHRDLLCVCVWPHIFHIQNGHGHSAIDQFSKPLGHNCPKLVTHPHCHKQNKINLFQNTKHKIHQICMGLLFCFYLLLNMIWLTYLLSNSCCFSLQKGGDAAAAIKKDDDKLANAINNNNGYNRLNGKTSDIYEAVKNKIESSYSTTRSRHYVGSAN